MINDRFPTFLYPVPSVEAPREMRAIIIRAKFCDKVSKKKKKVLLRNLFPAHPAPPPPICSNCFLFRENENNFEKKTENRKKFRTLATHPCPETRLLLRFFAKKKVKMLKLINQVSFAFFLGSID